MQFIGSEHLRRVRRSIRDPLIQRLSLIFDPVKYEFYVVFIADFVMFPLQFHAWWHCLSGIGAYLVAFHLMLSRARQGFATSKHIVECGCSSSTTLQIPIEDDKKRDARRVLVVRWILDCVPVMGVYHE